MENKDKTNENINNENLTNSNNFDFSNLINSKEITTVDVETLPHADLEEVIATNKTDDNTSKLLFLFSLFWSVAFLICTPLGAFFSGEGLNLFKDYWYILITPSKLVTDYFNIGGLGSSMLNAAICGFFCNAVILITKKKMTPTLLAAYFLVVAHCFYGLNILNFLPPFMGVLVYSLIRKQKFGDNLHIAMFATSLAPFVSEFLFRYPNRAFVFGEFSVTVLGVVLAITFGVIAGFIVPALLPGTTRMHKGYNLYKAGIAIGIFGLFVHALFFKTFGIESPNVVSYENLLDHKNQDIYNIFMNIFFATVFIITLIFGFILNGKTFKGYLKLLKDSGHDVDFPKEYGIGLTFVNIGIYGLMILLYMNAIILFTDGVNFTGATVGVIIAAITFTACGQHPKNVFPIIVGYVVYYLIAFAISKIGGFTLGWSLSSQSYINGLAFATGLCPFAGKYGFKIGVLAGLVCAIICSSTSAMHGGFVLYNGGFSAGLTAMVLVPILDFFNVKKVNEF